MSHSDSKPSSLDHKLAPSDSGECSSVPMITLPALSDAAVDAALCAVPLPDGLLARLSVLVAGMPEGATDHADWLGC